MLTLLLLLSLGQDSIFNNYAHVFVNEEHSGSAVYIGDGKFLTATHVITDSSNIDLIFDYSVIEARVVTSEGDVMILQTEVSRQTNVIFAEPVIGESVFWIQPVQLDRRPERFLMSGMVSQVWRYRFFIDKPIFPGASGSGVFNEQGELLGIATGHIRFNDSVPFMGSVTRIPRRLR